MASAVKLLLCFLVLGLFRPVVLAGVTGLQGSRIALRGREDIQVEELPENTLGSLVVYDRLRVAIAVGIVVHFRLTRLASALLLAALLATEQSAGEVAHGVLHLVDRTATALVATGQPAGEAAQGVLGLARHLTGLVGDLTGGVLYLPGRLAGLVGGLSRHLLGLIRDLSGSALRLIYHPAQSTFASLLLVTSQFADGILHALHGLTRLVGGLPRRILRLLLAALLLVLYFTHWLLLFEFVVPCPCDITNRVPILVATQSSPVRICAANVRHHLPGGLPRSFIGFSGRHARGR